MIKPSTLAISNVVVYIRISAGAPSRITFSEVPESRHDYGFGYKTLAAVRRPQKPLPH